MSQARHHNVGTFVDALLQASRGGEVQQSFLLTELPRVSEYAADPAASATLLARFSQVDHRVVIDGKVAATLNLCCQRCLSPVEVDIDDTFNVVVVPTENELDQLSDSQEAIVSDPARLDLAWLIEEQLLLAVPLVPSHASEEQCELKSSAIAELADEASDDVDEAPAEPSTQRPFASLRDLLKKV